MNISTFTRELKLISKHSQLIRSKLTSYGLSIFEINQYLVSLASCCSHSLTRKTGMINQSDSLKSAHKLESAQRYENFQQTILAALQENKQSLGCYLTRFLGRLELCLAQLEDYDQLSDITENKKIQQASFTKMSESNSDSSIPLSENSSKFLSSGEKIQNSSNESTAEIEGLKQEEARLENTLFSIVQKTKILRSLLEKQMLLHSMNQMESQLQSLGCRFPELADSFVV